MIKMAIILLKFPFNWNYDGKYPTQQRPKRDTNVLDMRVFAPCDVSKMCRQT